MVRDEGQAAAAKQATAMPEPAQLQPDMSQPAMLSLRRQHVSPRRVRGAKHPVRSRSLAAAAVTCALLAAGCGLLGNESSSATTDGADGDATAAAAGAPAFDTAEVVVKDLLDVVEIDGTLGYGEPAAVPNLLNGIATWLPDAGDLVGFGEPLYEVSAQPVVLLEGTTPMHRTLERRIDDGSDVERLETWLTEQGYADGLDLTVDESFTSVTEDAVEAWQTAAGLPVTGAVELGTVVYRAEPVRVSDVHVGLGDRVQGTPVLSVTSTSRHVTVALDTGDAGLLNEGDTVTVELPDGSEVSGTVTFVSSVARTEGQGAQQASYLDVEIALEGTGGAFDESPVTVSISDVLADQATVVPVAALVALAEGGFAVEAVNADGTTRLVAVTIDAIHGNEAAIEGALTAGQQVVVP